MWNPRGKTVNFFPTPSPAVKVDERETTGLWSGNSGKQRIWKVFHKSFPYDYCD